MKIADGQRACDSVLEAAPSVRNTIDRHMVMLKENSRNVKKADGVLLRFVIKYKNRLKVSVLITLYGMSQIEDDIASVKG